MNETPEVVRTAPERIWLQIAYDEDVSDQPFPHNAAGDGEITWCQDSVAETEVEYVRKDLAPPINLAVIREVIVRLRNYDDSAFNVWADKLARAIGDKP